MNADETTTWVSLSEAAKILGVHPATVRNWADQGHLPSQRTPGGIGASAWLIWRAG